jgi:mono/diheme cytochrome c family protein
MGPDIVGESSSEIYEVVRQGDGTMPAFSYQTLSDADLALLVDYIASWGGDGDHSSDDGDHGGDDMGKDDH